MPFPNSIQIRQGSSLPALLGEGDHYRKEVGTFMMKKEREKGH